MNKNIIILATIIIMAFVVFMINKPVFAPKDDGTNAGEFMIEEILVWPDKESFNLKNQSFDGTIWTGEEIVKIIVDDSTEIYKTSGPQWEKEYLNFEEFYFLIQNWEGPTWPFHIKGVYENGNDFNAKEVFLITQ